MALRLIELFIPEDDSKITEKITEELYIDLWSEKTSEGDKIIRMLTYIEYTEKILEQISNYFGERADFRVVLIPVVASIPRTNIDDEDAGQSGSSNKHEEDKVRRISKSELFEEVSGLVELSWVYITLIVMACIVAATGMIRDNPAIVIGAMVIAPILGPNVGLSIATTLGDKNLLIKSLRTIFVGFSLGLLFSIIMGIMIYLDPEVRELQSRTIIDYGDIALGFAAGVAGVLSFTRGISAAVIGVMVAVALLPPLVATGLLIGSGLYSLALSSALLTITYVICFNLAGIVTLLIQGVRPTSWKEKREKERYSPTAIVFWLVLLIVLAIIIYFR